MSNELKEIEFEINEEKIKIISENFKVNKKDVEELYTMYKEFNAYLKEQHLAHLMRGVECYIREHLGFKRFIVICEPYKKILDYQKPASSMYFPPIKKSSSPKNIETEESLFDQNNQSSFIIHYNGDLQPKEKRDYIAHEIGHLLFRVLLSKNKKNNFFIKGWDSNEITDSDEEKKSSILGIYIMSEKNNHYINFDRLKQNHKDWKSLSTHFKDITFTSFNEAV